MTPTLNIAALSRRTGVPADTIRKWEHRYGVLAPERTAGGQRRYSDQDVSRVEWLKARIGEGYRIGEAAALLGSGSSAAHSTKDLRRDLVAAAERSDVPALISTVEQALAIVSTETAFSDVLSPALIEIGEQWSRGALTVAQEHLASSTVRSALQRLLADARGSVRGVAVLACAPGERHDIGLLMLAVLMRADGWQVAYLGADTPFDDAVSLAIDLGAAALCFSACGDEPADALERALAGTRLPASLTVVVGGRATDGPEPGQVVSQLHAHAA